MPLPVLILAGGRGTRLSEFTSDIPKPMVEIDGKPIIEHIMEGFQAYGHSTFYVAVGYKSHVIKRYFLSWPSQSCAIWPSGRVEGLGAGPERGVNLVETGLEANTGSRLQQLRQRFGEIRPRCFATYGDGVSNVDLGELLKFHLAHGRLVTLTAVQPPGRYGSLTIDGSGCVTAFNEKPQQEWINGGFFVIEDKAFEYIHGNEAWERGPLQRLAAADQLRAYRHHGFWKSVDSLRDYHELQAIARDRPWTKTGKGDASS